MFVIIAADLVGRLMLLTLSELIRCKLCSSRFLPPCDLCKMGALERVLALCTLSLQSPGYKLGLNDRKTGVYVSVCAWPL